MSHRSEIPVPRNSEILLIENKNDDAMRVIQALRNSHFRNTINHQTDGRKAMDLIFGDAGFRPRKKLPGLVILSLDIPEGNSMEILRAIRSEARTSLIPVIILGSSTPANILIECYHLGIASFLVKPDNTRDYEEQVANIGLAELIANPGRHRDF
jgi:DNA-binding response OmpR family regulator